MQLTKYLLLASSCLVLTAGMASAAEVRHAPTYELPAQELSSALMQLARQSSRGVLYPSDMVAGKRSAAVKGQLSFEQALNALLAGSGLTYVIETDGSATIVRRPASPSAQPLPVKENTQFRGSGAASPAAQPTGGVEEIVVTGYRAQNQMSVAAKREDSRIAEFLSSDDIGQQPDYNIADSFRRVPGVQTIFDEDEGRYVSIRGLNPSYTLGSIDGGTLATAERGGRQLNMEAIPSTAVGGLDVLKSRTPDVEGNAIGGTVNLRSRSPFDHGGLYAVANAFIGTSDSKRIPGEDFNRKSDDGINFRFDGATSFLFGKDKQFGLLLSGNFSRKRRDQERLGPSVQMTSPNPTPALPNTSVGWNNYPNSVDRYGGTVKFEYRPSDYLRLGITASHFQQDDNELRLTQQIQNTPGSLVRFNDFPIEKPLTFIQTNFQWSPAERHQLWGRASYSEATFLEPSNQLQFNLTGAPPTFNVALKDGVPYVSGIDPRFNDPTQYLFNQYAPYQDDSDEYIREGQLDYAFNRGQGDLGLGFQAGFKARELVRDNDRIQTIYSGYNGGPLRLDQFMRTTNYSPLFADFNQIMIDFDTFYNFFNQNKSNFTINVPSTNINTIGSDYVVTETVTAGYALLEHRGERHRLIVGGRLENTSTDVERVRRTGTGANLSDFTRVKQSADYTNFLPSATFSYDFDSGIKLRLAYADAVGRPNPSDLGGVETVNADGSISRGNPDLKARKGRSYDASLEYYLPGDQGILSVGVFHKTIKNEIYRLTTRELIDGALVDVSQPRNAAEAKVSGLELNLVRNNLTFLPGFLKNFGVSANATLLKGETTVLAANGSGRKIKFLPQQSDLLGNLAVFYEQGGFRGRVTYAYVGEARSSVGATLIDDRIVPSAGQIDLQARYSLGKRVEIIGEVRNATNEDKFTIKRYAETKIYTDYNHYGRQFWLGVAVHY